MRYAGSEIGVFGGSPAVVQGRIGRSLRTRAHDTVAVCGIALRPLITDAGREPVRLGDTPLILQIGDRFRFLDVVDVVGSRRFRRQRVGGVAGLKSGLAFLVFHVASLDANLHEMRPQGEPRARPHVGLIFLNILEFLGALGQDSRAVGLGCVLVLVRLALLNPQLGVPGSPTALAVVTAGNTRELVGFVLGIGGALGQRTCAIAHLRGFTFFLSAGGNKGLKRQAILTQRPSQSRCEQGLGF
ncbi:MAG: hypothetical protein ACD_10C00793G0001, partial [uncultured bacterium]